MWVISGVTAAARGFAETFRGSPEPRSEKGRQVQPRSPET